MTALTIISLKKSDAWLISFDERDVFATFMTLSLPSSSTLIVKCSWIYLHASLKNKKDQIKTLHLCLFWVRILSLIDLLSKTRNNLMPLVLATLLACYYTNVGCFHSRGQSLCKFIGTKERICIRKEFNSHRNWSWYTNMAAVSFFGTLTWPPWHHVDLQIIIVCHWTTYH